MMFSFLNCTYYFNIYIDMDSYYYEYDCSKHYNNNNNNNNDNYYYYCIIMIIIFIIIKLVFSRRNSSMNINKMALQYKQSHNYYLNQ